MITALFVLLSSGSVTFADDARPGQLQFEQVAERLGIPTERGKCRRKQKDISNEESDWIERTMGRGFRESDPNADDWSCVMLKRHLGRDTTKHCMPAPEEALSFVPSEPITVTGKVKYLGFIRQGYKYEVDRGDTGLPRVTVRIHFKGEAAADPVEIAKVREKLAYASSLWTEKSPNRSLEFRFLQVDSPENAHYSVKLDRKDKATKFNSRWSIHDSKTIIAHEVGHMVGLDDEYAILRSIFWQIKNEAHTRRCNLRSLMCDFIFSDVRIYPYQYYVISRRAVCAAEKAGIAAAPASEQAEAAESIELTPEQRARAEAIDEIESQTE